MAEHAAANHDSYELPMFPLASVLLPHELLPLHVFEERYRSLIATCIAGDGHFGVTLISRGSEVGGGDIRYDTGTVAAIEVVSPTPDGRYGVLARGMKRLRVLSWLDDAPYPRALVRADADTTPDDLAVRISDTLAQLRELRGLWAQLGEGPALPDHVALGADFDEQVWRLCSATPLGPLDRQRLLEAGELPERLLMLDREIAERRAEFEALLK